MQLWVDLSYQRKLWTFGNAHGCVLLYLIKHTLHVLHRETAVIHSLYMQVCFKLPNDKRCAHDNLRCSPKLGLSKRAAGRVEYYYAEVDTWHTTHAGGMEVFYFATGQTEAHHPSGLKVLKSRPQTAIHWAWPLHVTFATPSVTQELPFRLEHNVRGLCRRRSCLLTAPYAWWSRGAQKRPPSGAISALPYCSLSPAQTACELQGRGFVIMQGNQKLLPGCSACPAQTAFQLSGRILKRSAWDACAAQRHCGQLVGRGDVLGACGKRGRLGSGMIGREQEDDGVMGLCNL